MCLLGTVERPGVSWGVLGCPGGIKTACVRDSPNGTIGNFTNGTIGSQ